MLMRSVMAVGWYAVSQTRSGPGVTSTPSSPAATPESTTRCIRAA